MIDPITQIPKGSTVILRAIVGSTAHGTNINQQADRDEMAIAIEPREYVIGMRHWETTVKRTAPDGQKSGPDDLDLQIHSLRKYCRLAAKGNPTMLLLLFVTDILEISALGKEMMERRHMFLSRECGKSFLGYMHAQKARLAGESGGRHGSRPELVAKHGYDVKYASQIIRLGHQGIELLTTGHMSLPMQPQHIEEVTAVRRGEWTLEQALTRAGELGHPLAPRRSVRVRAQA
jgi:hypothetical protein